MKLTQSILRILFCLVLSTCLVHITSARPVPQNLANGLDKLVENRLIEQGTISTAPAFLSNRGTNTSAKTAGAKGTRQPDFASYKASVEKAAARIASDAIKEAATGKYLVEIMPNGRVPVATLQSSLQTRFPLLHVTATNNRYLGHGVIEGYVALDDVPAMAAANGVGSVILQLRPIHNVGAVTESGVNIHRVNRVSTLYNGAAPHNYDGTGMQIGVLSDSYNSQPGEEGGFTTAQQDVATQDLPGTGNLTNSQEVVVLQDFINPPGATNEGRGMCQIVADMAPKARIGFASADVGELGFANNIRALAGFSGFFPAEVQQGFAGDVVCDDVSYLDEPMFQDGIVAQGVIDVVQRRCNLLLVGRQQLGNGWLRFGFSTRANGSGLTALDETPL